MRKQLVVQLAEQGGAPGQVSWVVREDERPLGSVYHGTLTEAANQAPGAQVVLLAPGTEVLLTQAQVPLMNRNRLVKAVPFVLEDELADDVDALHFAVGQRRADGAMACAVVSREVMDAWQAMSRAAGVQPHVLASEVLAVPFREGAWSLLIHGARTLLRTAVQDGLAMDTVNLALSLNALLAKANDTPPACVRVWLCDADETILDRVREVCAAHGIELVREDSRDPVLAMLARGYEEPRAINLLQGDYSLRERLGKRLRPWRPAAIVGALWLCLYVVLTVIEYRDLSARGRALTQQIEAVYRDAVPDARNVVNPKVQLERKLAELRGGDSAAGAGFLSLLARSGQVLSQNTAVNVRSIRYKANQLDLDVEIQDLQLLDALQQRLTEEAHLAVELISASQHEGKVAARLQLREKGV
jgi:general secretion pathway protein L